MDDGVCGSVNVVAGVSGVGNFSSLSSGNFEGDCRGGDGRDILTIAPFHWNARIKDGGPEDANSVSRKETYTCT